MKLASLFDHPNALPTAPRVVQELIESFDSEAVSIPEVTRKIAVDPVLSAKLLRLANSAYYHVSRSISTVDDAVTMLGFVTVRTLVISNGLVNGFKSMPGLDLHKFWRYSLHTAVAAKWLAKKAKQNSDEAFTVGMMHAIGQLVMHTAMPEQCLQIDKMAGPTDPRRLDIERTSFGYDFADVGAELSKRWKFPDAFANAIEHFPEPVEHSTFVPMAAILHLAVWRARTEENHLSEDELRATCPTEVEEKLGLAAYTTLDEMPPTMDLAAGLEELIS
jgi:HD-like signal output (HDOD) protein